MDSLRSTVLALVKVIQQLLEEGLISDDEAGSLEQALGQVKATFEVGPAAHPAYLAEVVNRQDLTERLNNLALNGWALSYCFPIDGSNLVQLIMARSQ